MKKMKGFGGKKTLRHILQYGDYHREKVVGEVEEGKRGRNSDGRRLDLGW